MSRWMHELKWPDVAEYLKSQDIVLIPIGNVEQHGRHLPLMTDSAQAIDVADAAAERTGVLVAPPLWIGWTVHHMGFPGSFTLRSDTLIRLAEDVSNCLVWHGFKKLIWISRGSNTPALRMAQVRIRNRTNAFVAVVDHLELVWANRQFDDWDVNSHAGGAETSHMLYLHPDLVDLELATPDPWPYRDVTTVPTVEEFTRALPSGGGGDPRGGSAERGKAIFDYCVDRVVQLIEEVRALKIDLKQADLPL